MPLIRPYRRAFLTATAAAATATKAADAATEGPFGKKGGSSSGHRIAALGAAAHPRYPDAHFESLDKRFKGSVGTGAVERRRPPFAGLMGLRFSRPAATRSSATYPTTA
jgi:hypothetical protein